MTKLSALIMLAAIVLASVFGTMVFTKKSSGGGSTDIAKYLDENPMVVYNALMKAQGKMAEDQASQEKEKISKRRAEIEDAAAPFLGNKDAKNIVVKFSDYNCGYCKTTVDEYVKLVTENKNVKVILRDMPILGDASRYASGVAVATFRTNPDKYQALHIALLKHSGRTEDSINEVIASVGLDVAKIKAEAAKPEVQTILNKNGELGRDLGIQGTPTFIINGEMLKGAADYAKLKELTSK
jgi:protein-disulfide isomerase